ncbi:site-specific integrase [Lysobacter sp. MMG2]|nr:site-specific integrase [Lysobacter sp. MMG2]MBU8977652.1 site-specific integrase [Lysobacter sp. MMG2]
MGRVEITRSLRTGDRREALRRLVLWETHVGMYLNKIHRRGAGMTREQLDLLRDRFLSASFDEIEERLSMDWSETGLDVHRWDLAEEAEALTAGLANVDYHLGLPWARSMLPKAEDEVLRRLARRLMEAKLDAIKAELVALSGEPLRQPVVISERPSSVPSTLKHSPKVSELAKLYGDERVAIKSWSPRTEHQYRGYLAVLADLLGDPEVAAVTKDDMRRLGLTLIKLPANLTKRFPGMTPSQAVAEAGDASDIPRLAANSVNAYYQAIRSFFAWVELHDHVRSSPATVLKDVKRGRASEDRKPFDDADLSAYFAMLKLEREKRPFLYWIPYILAFSGCRLGEAAQLRKQDIRQESGLWVFDINEAEGRRLKNESSPRLVPVHPRLVELGLLEHISQLPPGFLWPADMRTPADPTRSAVDKLQKLLARHLRRAGITDPKKTAAHSFRHTIPARLKALSVPEYQIADILGHENESMSTGRYGTTTDIQRLAEVVKLISLPI